MRLPADCWWQALQETPTPITPLINKLESEVGVPLGIPIQPGTKGSPNFQAVP